MKRSDDSRVSNKYPKSDSLIKKYKTKWSNDNGKKIIISMIDVYLFSIRL